MTSQSFVVVYYCALSKKLSLNFGAGATILSADETRETKL
jgi:hypothetical protein